MDPLASFRALSDSAAQEEIQAGLAEIHRRWGLQAAMDCLFEWELKAGYITREKLEGIERLELPDPQLGVTFHLQINYARSRYQSKPARQESLPPVHCAICKQNVGRPGKEALRIYEFPLDGKRRWFFLQLTPFPLFSHHFVLILSQPLAQCIDEQTVRDMFAFLALAPEYTVCSNSDVEWAGSSILEHLHFQVFKGLRLPVQEASALPGFRGLLGSCGLEILRYPLAAIRLAGERAEEVAEAASRLIRAWKALSPGRNTVNLLLLREAGAYRFFVFLRNPDYRTAERLRRFKSEGVGVIEASGEIILPVPEGPEAPVLWRQIRGRGLQITRGILESNNPVRDPQSIQQLVAALGVETIP